jgi:hypothetical protein
MAGFRPSDLPRSGLVHRRVSVNLTRAPGSTDRGAPDISDIELN